MTCILCNTRKAKRSCPAAQGEICAQCCAERREETLDCPLDCPFLLEARKHEKLAAKPASAVPHPEVRLSEDFMHRNDMLLRFVMVCVASAVGSTPRATDADAREAIDASVTTLKTADSGLIYETRPVNPFALSIQDKLNQQIERLRREVAAHTDGATLRDKDLLGVLVFLSRVAVSLDNGRRKCRAFISMLHDRLGTPVVVPPDEAEGAQAADAPALPASGLIITP